jgi:KDO2-lipid IV(A) lauroyltransferase
VQRLLAEGAHFILIIGIGSLPLRIRRLLGRMLGVLVPLFVPKETLITKLQLQRYLGLTEAAASNLVTKIFQHTCTNLFIALNTKPLITQMRVSWESQTNVTEAMLRNIESPILALTGHLGNWDLLGAYCNSVGLPVSTIGRKARAAFLQPLLAAIRSRNGVTTIWREDSNSPRQILQALRHRGVLAALIDQDTTVRSDFVPFFNVPVKTPSGLFALATKSKAFVVSAFLVEINANEYRLYIEHIPEHLSEKEALAQYHQHLESVIRKHPEQWAWFHKRWRSSPDGTTLGTKAYVAKLLDELARCSVTISLCWALCIASSLSLTGCMFQGQEPLLTRADQLRQDKQYDQAIALYQEHIDKRLRIHQREDWENPYFYELLIGDTYLEQDKLSDAKAAYRAAYDHEVDRTLFLDRIRLLAAKYEEKNEFQTALDLLKPYANEDPLLINAQLDRIAKALAASTIKQSK